MNARSSRPRVLLAGILALALILGTLPTPVAAHLLADATPIVVDTTADSLAVDGLCSLREAISAVNAHAVIDTCGAAGGFDLIMLPAGTYALTIPGASEDENATGDLDIKADVTIEGAGPETTIIDAAGLDRVLQIHQGMVVALTGLTIQNGLAPDGFTVDGFASDGQDGGGIHNAGSLTLTGCVVTQNRTGNGSNCSSYEGCHSPGGAGGRGGGIYTSGGLKLIDAIIRTNKTGKGSRGVPAGPGGNGGGIAATGAPVEIKRSTVEENVAGPGYDSPQQDPEWFSIRGCNGGSGGGVYIIGAKLTVQESLLRANVTGDGKARYELDHGGAGGAIAGQGADITVTGSEIASNRTGSGGYGGDGGGIGLLGGSLVSAPLSVENM